MTRALVRRIEALTRKVGGPQQPTMLTVEFVEPVTKRVTGTVQFVLGSTRANARKRQR